MQSMDIHYTREPKRILLLNYKWNKCSLVNIKTIQNKIVFILVSTVSKENFAYTVYVFFFIAFTKKWFIQTKSVVAH